MGILNDRVGQGAPGRSQIRQPDCTQTHVLPIYHQSCRTHQVLVLVHARLRLLQPPAPPRPPLVLIQLLCSRRGGAPLTHTRNQRALGAAGWRMQGRR